VNFTTPLVVTVKPLDRDVGGNLDGMTAILSWSMSTMDGSGKKRRGESGSGGGGGGGRGEQDRLLFVAGDLVCLARREDVLQLASEGRLYSECGDQDKMTLHGVIGHVEYTKKSADGLKVRISRQKWIKFCKGVKLGTLYLWNLGGNVTSAREFAALCRVNTFPMLPYILCRKMTKAKDNLDLLSDSICGEMPAGVMDESLQKDDYLKKLGGNAALGEGFVNHVRQKFNVSQLGAISSAALKISLTSLGPSPEYFLISSEPTTLKNVAEV
jgi:hypothetical protein